jgi:hypothetical protein
MRSSIFVVLAVAGCSSTHLTQFRSGWRGCKAADPNLIECRGKQVAQIECYHPADEACGALAVRYADGERVFLYRPPGFEPGGDVESRSVLRPELSSDATMIWYKPPNIQKDTWAVFEPETGVYRTVDSFKIFQMRERDPHSMPLWIVDASK